MYKNWYGGILMSKLLEDLKYRDLVYQQTDEEGIKVLLE